MPELRKDPVTGRWVIISTERRKRPNDFRFERPSIIGREQCPFCPGQEALTPPEVLAYRQNGGGANSSDWVVRVVPNKFPALQVEGGLDREGDGMFDRMNGIGAHEVIIETPDHDKTFASMSEPEIERVLSAYRERRAGPEAGPPAALHPGVQEPGRHGRRDARARALAADRAAGRAGLRARGDRRRAAAFRGEGALRVLRHRAPGDGERASASSRRTPTSSRWRRMRRGFRSRRGCCRAGMRRGSRMRRGTSTRASPGC